MLEFPNLVLSYHNFEETPENLMESFSELTALAPRVVKVAVMPQSEQDVIDLMNYTRGFKTLNPEQEYATMSMGKLGRVSRFAVDVFRLIMVICKPRPSKCTWTGCSCRYETY